MADEGREEGGCVEGFFAAFEDGGVACGGVSAIWR